MDQPTSVQRFVTIPWKLAEALAVHAEDAACMYYDEYSDYRKAEVAQRDSDELVKFLKAQIADSLRTEWRERWTKAGR